MIKHCLSVLLISTLVIFSACSGSSSENKLLPHDNDTTQAERLDTLKETYTNSRYDISLQKPDDWILVEEPNLNPGMGTFAINIFKSGTKAAKETPLHVHAKAQHSYVAIWPHGIGTELPAGQYSTFKEAGNVPNLQFEVNKENSKVLQLKNESAWAWFIVPQNPPENWEKQGFVFAQVNTIKNSATCYDQETGEQISINRCNYLAGDKYVREGDRNQSDVRTIRHLLESISLDSVKKEQTPNDLIMIEKPLPNMDITSPLTIRGKARGQWYFEGSFRVELVNADGSTIAEGQAKSKGEWMTKDFVPFTATVAFVAPDDERGKLIFHRSNPSGLPENAQSYSLPVIFPPK